MNATEKLKAFSEANGWTPEHLITMARCIDLELKLNQFQEADPAEKPGQDKPVVIDLALLERLYFGIMSLKAYIDQMPPDNPVTWMADRNRPVSTMPDYEYATKAMDEAKQILKANGRRITG